MQIQGHSNSVKLIFGKQLFQNTQRNYDFRPKEEKSNLLFSCFHILFWLCCKDLYIVKKMWNCGQNLKSSFKFHYIFYMANYLSAYFHVIRYTHGRAERKTRPRCQDCSLAYSGCTNWKLKMRAVQVTDTVGQMGFIYPRRVEMLSRIIQKQRQMATSYKFYPE